MARLYTITRNNVTPNTSNDLLTIIAPSGGPVRLKRVRATGEATSSTVMRTVIQRSTGGTTGGGAVTPEKVCPTDAAAGSTVNTTWSGQPTLSGNPHYNEGWNAFGGGFDLVLDGREMIIEASAQVSIRNTVGTGTMDLDVEIEEM
jgi:hypothetical protein